MAHGKGEDATFDLRIIEPRSIVLEEEQALDRDINRPMASFPPRKE